MRIRWHLNLQNMKQQPVVFVAYGTYTLVPLLSLPVPASLLKSSGS